MGLIVGYVLGGGSLPAPAPAEQKQPPTVARVPTPPPTPQPQPQPQPQPPPPPAGDVAPVDPTDHIRGNPNAEISIIEYSDYECPFCQRVHGTHQALLEAYGSKVNWVYRHYPLGPHKNAMPTAIAAECVATQGGNDAFWEFTDMIFAKEGEERWDYASHVKNLGLNGAAFTTCFDARTHEEEIQAEMDAGEAAGVRGTPGNFIIKNSTGEAREVGGAQPIDNFKKVIDEMLQ